MFWKNVLVRDAVGVAILGGVFMLLGTALIQGAQRMLIPSDPVYYWDTSQLAIGILLALIGTVMAVVPLTYLVLYDREKSD